MNKSLMEQNEGNSFLITTDNWFFAPDGSCYRAVWGKVQIFNSEETLGVKTNVRSTNWYAIVGEGDKQVIVAGCQIHYAVMCNNKPNTPDRVKEVRISESQAKAFVVERENSIYLAQ